GMIVAAKLRRRRPCSCSTFPLFASEVDPSSGRTASQRQDCSQTELLYGPRIQLPSEVQEGARDLGHLPVALKDDRRTERAGEGGMALEEEAVHDAPVMCDDVPDVNVERDLFEVNGPREER